MSSLFVNDVIPVLCVDFNPMRLAFGGLYFSFDDGVSFSQPASILRPHEGSTWKSRAEIPAQSGKVILREDPHSSGSRI